MSARGFDKGVRHLQERTSCEVEKVGIIAAAVTMPQPLLAEAVVNRAVGLMDRFRAEPLQFESRQQRAFAERRVSEVEAGLWAVEGA